MTVTAIGVLATAKGNARQVESDGAVDLFTLPASAYEQIQPRDIPVWVDHDAGSPLGPLGHVAYLERSKGGGLLVVATLHDRAAAMLADTEHGAWHWSPGCKVRPTGPTSYGHARCFEVSLTQAPAIQSQLAPVLWARTDITRDDGAQPHGMPLAWRSSWHRAHLVTSSYEYRHRRSETVILDVEAIGQPAPEPTPPPVLHQRAEPTLRINGRPVDPKLNAAAFAAMGYEQMTDGSLVRIR
jgi:hypothetical protein